MCRNNYFIAMYDKEDNYIRDFNNISECALYFHISKKHVSDYLFRGSIRDSKYRLFKIVNDQTYDLNKSFQESEKVK